MNKINLLNGNYLCYNKGKFDEWCVYEVDEKGLRKAPKDIDYFNDLKNYTKTLNSQKIYNDFIIIYDMTNKTIEENVIKKIESIALNYEKYSIDIFRIFATIYMAMIAEENKKHTKLGKRIKRLGIYFLLIKNQTPEYCANFMRGKTWKEIDILCKEGGF